MYLILGNLLNIINNVSLCVYQIINLETMCILRRMKRGKNHHKVCIFNHESDFYITPPLKLLAEKLLSLPKLFVVEMIEPWISHNIQVVSQLSKNDVCNKQSKKRNKCLLEERIRKIF